MQSSTTQVINFAWIHVLVDYIIDAAVFYLP